jgi:primosomal protein N' (replication factor Y)
MQKNLFTQQGEGTDDGEVAQQSASQQPAGETAPKRVMSVLVPYPVDKVYDYAVPQGLEVAAGDYVVVPLGKREIPAVVWGEAAGDVAPSKLKPVISRYDFPPMAEVQRRFIDRAADYTMNARGFVLKMSLSVPAGLEPPKPITAYTLAADLRSSSAYLQNLNPRQQAVCKLLSDGVARRMSEIADQAGASSAAIKTLLKKGVLEAVDIYSAAPCRNPQVDNAEAVKLSGDQEQAALALIEMQRSESFQAALLDGVTGAGKTETYFEAVAEALRQDKQVLILLPEIALSNAFLERFKARFGCAPALWHSHLTKAQRKNTWRGVANGETRVVIGARSALFLPYAALDLIVVDEEHDPAYKQEDGALYHARDMAVLRAHLGGFPIILVSATPSLETMHNAWNGRYRHLHLPARFGGAQLPSVYLIDMRRDKPERQHFISPVLVKAAQETLDSGEQVLFFLNRRGYAPLTLCRTCGHRMNCPRCTAWLVEHRAGGSLQCHHCGYAQKSPKECPECGDKGSMAACGPGVERIYEEAKALFPDRTVMVLASDTADSNEALKDMLEQIRSGAIDIVIGTQIIAKGHHFPNLTLVGVIDADLGLQGGDLRAAERTYQLLHQVAGRAGRAEKPGRVFLQSFMPEHRIMQAMTTGARDEFLEAESWEREQAHMPPYSRLAGIIVSGREESQVLEVAKQLGRISPQGRTESGLSIQTLGPAAAPLARLRGKYRYRLLVNADKAVNLQKTLAEWVGAVKIPSTVRVQIDIDPQSFL